MSTIILTPETSEESFLNFIRERLAAGQRVQVTATEPFLTPQEMADELDVSRAFIMNKIKAGDIASTRRGSRHRISTSEVDRFRRSYFSLSAQLLGQDL
ncbi:MAG: helix-turn-helix domain-containing protein [Promicromonosporaceae bacterium]|nr:helix-turn-helix domain-containing protein [Promicromonosporaceae bacterium]